jgi:hypothetical protein
MYCAPFQSDLGERAREKLGMIMARETFSDPVEWVLSEFEDGQGEVSFGGQWSGGPLPSAAKALEEGKFCVSRYSPDPAGSPLADEYSRPSMTEPDIIESAMAGDP